MMPIRQRPFMGNWQALIMVKKESLYPGGKSWPNAE
jgi:hypothetical protein